MMVRPNMSGSRNGVAKQNMDKDKCALYTHCYGHALNLTVSNTVKQSKVCKDALETAFEVTRLVKFFPKQNAALKKFVLVYRRLIPALLAFAPSARPDGLSEELPWRLYL